MPSFAVISDIHSNLPALEAVLKKVDELRAERIYCLGDIVGYGPFPNECVKLVREHCQLVVKGNHDSALLGETSVYDFNRIGQQALRWTSSQIHASHLDFLRQLPLVTTSGDSTFVHASPSDPIDWKYLFTYADAVAEFDAFETDRCFVGHTHIPALFEELPGPDTETRQRKTLINVGSVGQPRDNNPLAAFGIFHDDERGFTLIRVPYDIPKTAAAITSAGLPLFLAQRLFQGI